MVLSLVIGLSCMTGALAAPPTPREKPPAPSDHRGPEVESLKNAFDLARKGDARATDALPASAGSLERDLVIWTRLRESNGGSFDDYRKFIETHEGWPLLELLRRKAEASIMVATDDGDILTWFARFPAISGIGKLHHAAALLRAKRESEALPLLRAGWRSAALSVADERYFSRILAAHITAEDDWARVDHLLWDRRRSDAARLFGRLDADHRALAEARSGLIASAWNVDPLVSRVPEDLRDNAGLVLERAYWRRIKGKYEGAEALMLGPEARGPILRPDRWWQERHLLARRALREGRREDAYRLAAEHRLSEDAAAAGTMADEAEAEAEAEAETGTATGEAGEPAEDGNDDLAPRRRAGIADAEWLAGWIALRFLDRPVDALAHFERMRKVVSLPISIARAHYWSGRAAIALGDADLGRRFYQEAAEFQSVFYGQLAREEIGLPGAAPQAAPLIATEEERRAFEDQPLVRAIRLLAAAGEERALAYFIRKLAEDAGSPGDSRLLAELGQNLERPQVGVIVAKRSSNNGLMLLEEGYPLLQESDNLPTTRRVLVHAIARQESQFDPRAVSHVGALGLMQIMPSTARRLARRLGSPYSRERLLSDPAFNLTLGETYLTDLMRRYGNSPILALAAYNAGPGPVDRWLAEYGDPRRTDIDPIDWIELVPYGETRNYIQRVIEAAPLYGMRVAGDAPPSLRDFIALGRDPEIGRPGL